MEVSRVRALRGPNLWSHHTSIEAIVACAPGEESIAFLAGFETREYRTAHVVSAGCSVKVCLRPGIHLCPRVEDDLPDDLGRRGAAGLTGEVCRRSRTFEQWSDGAYQGGLAREVRALDRYEDAPPCTLRGWPSS